MDKRHHTGMPRRSDLPGTRHHAHEGGLNSLPRPRDVWQWLVVVLNSPLHSQRLAATLNSLPRPRRLTVILNLVPRPWRLWQLGLATPVTPGRCAELVARPATSASYPVLPVTPRRGAKGWSLT